MWILSQLSPNMNARDFDDMMQAAFKEAHGTYAVPKYMTEEDCKQILYVISQQK